MTSVISFYFSFIKLGIIKKKNEFNKGMNFFVYFFYKINTIIYLGYGPLHMNINGPFGLRTPTLGKIPSFFVR